MRRKHLWYAVIAVVFNIEVWLISQHGLPVWTVWQWCMFPFAVLRLGRLLAFDGVMEPFRRPFARAVQHWTGTGDTTEAVPGDGFMAAVGDLLSCPICSGTHAGLILLALASFAPAWGTMLLYATAGIGAAELLNAILEGHSWSSEFHRVGAGQGAEYLRDYRNNGPYTVSSRLTGSEELEG